MEKSKLLKSTQNYRKTPKGVLTNMYHKMKSRREVEFSLSEFHERYLCDPKFLRLHEEWIKSGMDKMKKPSLDRISNKKGYTVSNTHMITWAENRHKQVMERRSRKGCVLQFLNGEVVAEYKSQKEAVSKTGISQGNMSEVLNKKRAHCNGFVFVYKSNTHQNPELIGK